MLLWDANTLDRWAAETPVSHGELLTARFLLAVWDPGNDWRCGRFDVMDGPAGLGRPAPGRVPGLGARPVVAVS